MKKIILFILGLTNLLFLSAQNLVVNPGAESMPRGIGWTIVNEGATTCLLLPTSNYLNWTIIPNGTANYPFDHTTGAAGGTIFYAGCSAAFVPAFELRQDIDVSADAVSIDLGIMQYVFSGFMQTPVTNQTDRGRFIVDYLDASNTITGTSYTSSWQSNFSGSGIGWNSYTDTKIAPVGTRVVRIRLQAQIFFNTPAVNVYFDDITFTKPVVLPVTLLSFTGHQDDAGINVNWKVTDEINLSHYELEQSSNGLYFTKIAAIAGGKTSYSFIDKNISYLLDKYFYRLKIVNTNGTFSYSKIVPVLMKEQHSMVLSPNPGKNFVTVTAPAKLGMLTIIDADGRSIFSLAIHTQTTTIPVWQLPAGLYVVRFNDGKNSSYKKLVVQK